MKYLGLNSIHFPTGPTHNSPCMSSYWWNQEIRQGIKREGEPEEKDEIIEEEDELTDD